MRLARGPFWLGSISKLTRSPPASESKFTLETGPVEEVLPTILSRDEAEPSIGYKLLDGACRHVELLFSKVRYERTGPFEKNRRPRRTSPTSGDASSLPRGPAGSFHSASRETPTRVAPAPAILSAADRRSRSFQTPHMATATTAVSRTGATTERGAI